MPAKTPKMCRERGCIKPTIHKHGLCEDHKHKASNWQSFADRQGGSKRIYNSSKWRNTVKAIKDRDKGLCQHCLDKGLITPGTDCDHITPVSKGGNKWSYSNLQLLCRECHKKKTIMDSRG